MVISFDIAFGMGYKDATEVFRNRTQCPYCEVDIPADARICTNCRQILRRCTICNIIITDLDTTTEICSRCFSILTDTQNQNQNKL